MLEPEQLTVMVINDGPEPVTISQATINEVFWKYLRTHQQSRRLLEIL